MTSSSISRHPQLQMSTAHVCPIHHMPSLQTLYQSVSSKVHIACAGGTSNTMSLVYVPEYLTKLLCGRSCLPLQLQPWRSVQPLQCIRSKSNRKLQHWCQGLLQRHLPDQRCPGYQCDVQLLWHLQLCRSWSQLLSDRGAPLTLPASHHP